MDKSTNHKNYIPTNQIKFDELYDIRSLKRNSKQWQQAGVHMPSGNRSKTNNKPPEHMRNEFNARKYKSHRLRNALLITFIVFAALLLLAAGFSFKFYRDAMQIKNHEEIAFSNISGLSADKIIQDPDTAISVIPKVQAETSAANRLAHSRVWDTASAIPGIGDDVKNLQGTVEILNSTSHNSLPVLSDTIRQLVNTAYNQGNGQINLRPLTAAGAGFAQADRSIQAQSEKLKSLPYPLIRQVQNVYTEAEKQFSYLADTTSNLNRAVHVIPQLLGIQGPRSYIIGAQTPS